MMSLGIPGVYLIMFTIYQRPKDFPEHFVVRRSFVTEGKAYAERATWAVEKTLEDARMTIPNGKCLIPRSPIDDPVIVETWI